MFTLMSITATGGRLIGYGAIFLLFRAKEPTISPWYGVVLTAEILQVLALIGLEITARRRRAKGQQDEEIR